VDTPINIPEMSGEKIVDKLLENDEAIDPKEYVAAMGEVDLSNITPEQVATFKRQATGYIKWISGEAYDPRIARDIEAAPTFDAVARILSLYDEPGLSFLSMVEQGYF
jgi:hypothetical protein